jgi:signal transduction histidine kinase
MRTMLLELRPTAITHTPLEDLLAQLTEAITSRNRLPFQLYIERIPPLPEEVHTSFYRIAQESLNNVVKHAQARLVSVSLSAAPYNLNPGDVWQGKVMMTIRDDGRGFDPRSREAEHLGLGIMHERAALIGATLNIKCRPDEGTEVTLSWQN